MSLAEHPAASNRSASIPTRAIRRRSTRGRAPRLGRWSAPPVLWSRRARPGAARAVGFSGGSDPIILVYRPAAVRLPHLGFGHVYPAEPVGLADVHARPLARPPGSRASTLRFSTTSRLLVLVEPAPASTTVAAATISACAPQGCPSECRSSAPITTRSGAPELPGQIAKIQNWRDWAAQDAMRGPPRTVGEVGDCQACGRRGLALVSTGRLPRDRATCPSAP